MTVEEQRTMRAIQNINKKLPDLELRDLFAMSALNGMYANNTYYTDATYRDFATMAYEQADAILEERNKK